MSRSSTTRGEHGATLPSRLCYAEAASNPDEGSFKYYPSYCAVNSTIALDLPLPAHALDRCDDLLEWVKTHAPVISKKTAAIGMVYFGHRDEEGRVLPLSVATFFVLSHKGKRIPTTAFHSIQKMRVDVEKIEAYVTPDHSGLDLEDTFNAGVLPPGLFEKVDIRLDLLEARKKYIEWLYQEGSAVVNGSTPPTKASDFPRFLTEDEETQLKNSSFVSENLDPKFNLQPTPTLDVMFLNFPDHVLAKFDATSDIPLATSAPVPHTPVVLVSMQSAKRVLHESYLKDQYNHTYYRAYPPATHPQTVLFPNRSVTLAMVKEVGAGVVGFEACTSETSNGGPFVDSSGAVVAINLCAYYDTPGTSRYPPFTMLFPDMLHGIDIVLPENSRTAISKNWVSGLSVFHPAFLQLLEKV